MEVRFAGLGSSPSPFFSAASTPHSVDALLDGLSRSMASLVRLYVAKVEAVSSQLLPVCVVDVKF